MRDELLHVPGDLGQVRLVPRILEASDRGVRRKERGKDVDVVACGGAEGLVVEREVPRAVGLAHVRFKHADAADRHPVLFKDAEPVVHILGCLAGLNKDLRAELRQGRVRSGGGKERDEEGQEQSNPFHSVSSGAGPASVSAAGRRIGQPRCVIGHFEQDHVSAHGNAGSRRVPTMK